MLKSTSLLARMALVLVLTLAVVFALTRAVFLRDQAIHAARREANHSADRIGLALSFVRTGQVALPLEAAGLLVQRIPLAIDAPPVTATRPAEQARFESLLRRHLDGAELIHAQAGPNYATRVRLPSGELVQVTVVHTPPGHAPPPPPWVAFVGLAGALAVALAAATVWVTRPLRRLVQAANRIDTLGLAPRVDETGPDEVAVVLRAFNRMRDRIDRQTADRLQVLQGVSHDLKTPLTRLRFRVDELADDMLRDAVVRDITSMQAMVSGALNYARMLDSAQPSELIDLAVLLRAVCDDANDAGGQAGILCQMPSHVIARPAALHRAFANLVENAIRYGGRAEVTIEAHDADVVVRIRDGGAGIDDKHLAHAFEPYYRGDGDGDGSGLGLSIARDCFIRHGGHIKLENHPDGGLEVNVRLPRAAAGAMAS